MVYSAVRMGRHYISLNPVQLFYFVTENYEFRVQFCTPCSCFWIVQKVTWSIPAQTERLELCVKYLPSLLL